MLERSLPVLRIVCLGLAALVLVQLPRLALHNDPLARLKVPPAISTSRKPDRDGTATNAVPARDDAPRPSTNLPPVLQARLERITQSEILAPVMHPPPMALLGIAGPDVFLRTPSGQTGLLREGGELGGVKLLRVGTNRVLIELEGQQRELTLFSGLGSETLLPKGKETRP